MDQRMVLINHRTDPEKFTSACAAEGTCVLEWFPQMTALRT